MKPLFLFVALGALLTSCTEYQYLTVSGANILKNEKNELISENDTVKVQYYFADYRGKIGIRIFNKSGQPLEIDWKKSAVIRNGQSYAYFQPNATIKAMLEDSLRLRSIVSGINSPAYLASLNGSIRIDEPTQFIPPASSIYKVPLVLPVEQIPGISDEQSRKESYKWAENVFVSYKKLVFENAGSPLKFRSYLTFRIGSTAAQKEFYLEHNFFVSEVWKTTSGPDNFPSTLINRGDRFYLKP